MILAEKVDELDCRVRDLERNEARTDQRINDLITSLDNFLWWMKSLVMLLLAQMFGSLAYLIVHWVKGGG